MKTFAFTCYLVYTTAVISVVTSQYDYGDIDVSAVNRLSLRNEGDTGTVVFKGEVTDKTSPSVLRIQSKPNCYMSIKPKTTFKFNNNCFWTHPPQACMNGCFYAYVFDGYYYNDHNATMKHIWDSNWKDYNTTSSVLYVAVCHTGITNHDMQLTFTAVERRFVYEGDSVLHRTGEVMSSLFPNPYIQNGEQTTYVFRSRNPTDKVVIEFDDFDIAPGGALYFNPSSDYRFPIIINDATPRPVVQSDNNELQLIFDTGWPGSSYRNNLGFKASYRFITAHEFYQKPNTNCGKYYMTLDGGHIEFKPQFSSDQYDCVWVVKTQPGYKGTYMKLNRFSSVYSGDNNSGDVKVEIHKGLTSNGLIVGTLFPKFGGSYRDFEDEEGFYIRLRGIYRNSITFKLAFASYKNYYASGCNSNTHFKCSNGYCIPGQLACEANNMEHCKDGSDESIGCSGSYDTKSDHTLTVSVIIPIVVSIFLLIVLSVLFVLVRRCRQAQQFTNMMRESNDPVVCTTDRRRTKRGHDYFQRPADAPPTYDEALITGIPVPDDEEYPPKPPPYSETADSLMMEDSSDPAPPYYSTENVNQSFLDDNGSPIIERQRTSPSNSAISEQDAVSTSTQTRHANVHRNYHKHSNGQPKLHMLDTGRLPDLHSIQATIGTQSMCNISNIGQNSNLTKARSEQILSPRDLGVVNQAYQIDDQDQQSRLYKGQAVSNLELPTGRHHQDKNRKQADNNAKRYESQKGTRNLYQDRPQNHNGARGQTGQIRSGQNRSPEDHQRSSDHPNFAAGQQSAPERSHTRNQYSPNTKQSSRERLKSNEGGNVNGGSDNNQPSARDRLKPKDPVLSKKYYDELQRREQNKNKQSMNYQQREQPHAARKISQENTGARNNSHNKTGARNNSQDKTGASNNSCDKISSNGHLPNRNTDRILNNQESRRREIKSKNKDVNLTGRNGMRQDLDENKDSHEVARSKHQLGGSNVSLHLCAGNRSEIHRSSVSLNENMLGNNHVESNGANMVNAGHNGQSMVSAGHNVQSSCKSLDDIGEDVLV
ncbi:unnamed protein product [Mytilus edulis]|uniref:CUB domain-containing protein n=1 Tax=Mytilus edulis TaxID=6550 RepID=A0A8S3TGY1_MYTED|nr:unnamed protein product [Mytilus edulis]